MVYTVLQRLVTTLESLFKNGGSDNRAEQEQRVRELVAQNMGAYGMSHVAATSTREDAQPNPRVLTFPPQEQASARVNELKE